MDKDVENLVCHGCQVSSSCERILVVVDYYSRFLEVALLKSTQVN